MFVWIAVSALARDAALLGVWPDPVDADRTREQILQKGWFDTVPAVDLAAGTPTAAALAAYDAVLVYPTADFPDPEGLGDVLAAYLEGGGGVVLGHGAFSDDQGLGGAFTAYLPLLPGPAETGGRDLVPLIPDHAVLVGTTWFDAGAGHRTASPGPAPGAELVATWGDGVPLVGALETAEGRRVVALNLFPTPGVADPSYWQPDCDVDDLMARSLLWTTGYAWPFETACWAATVRTRDRNCNGVEAADELPVDLDDPRCAANVDPATGLPFPNRDEYVDYEVHRCRYPVTAYDPDQDGFGAGLVEIYGDDGLVESIVALSCDNCENEWNPLQEDVDCDAVGDVCDGCVEEPTGEVSFEAGGFASDQDPWSDGCDPCPAMFDLDAPPDSDGDGVLDCDDNCDHDPNPDQRDVDQDGRGDVCDLCPTVAGGSNEDLDGDGVGGGCDNCPAVANPDQADTDRDGDGDLCDPCPLLPRQPPENRDGDARNDVCDPCPDVWSEDPDADADSDGFGDVCDLCPTVASAENGDRDGDGVGDACDLCPELPEPVGDADGDGIGDPCDVCPDVPDPLQRDVDGDGRGDACDPCPLDWDEPGQDRDGDGIPDACDECPDEPGHVCAAVALRGGGRVCGTAVPGAWWLGLLILAVRRGRR